MSTHMPGAGVPEDVRQRVFAACEKLAGKTTELLADLVRIPSENPGYKYDEKMYRGRGYTDLYDEPITRGGETRVAKFLEPVLKDFCHETWLVAKDPLRSNLIGFMGSGGGKSLALNAHIDTVPTGPHEGWTETGGDPFNPVIKDGRMYGRGTTDDKGPAAAIVGAAMAIHEAGLKPAGQLQLHLTVGEETGEGETFGPGWFIRQYPELKTDACIVAEGSSPPYRLGVVTTSSGVSCLNVTVTGKPVHAAMRYRTIRSGYEGEEVGVNAIDKAMRIYRALYELEQEWALKKDASGLSPRGFACIPIGWVHGNPSGIELPFFVADHCELGMAVWRYPLENLEEVKAEVNRVIWSAAESDHWLREHPPEVDWWYDWPPFHIGHDHPLVQTVSSAYSRVLGTEASYMAWQAVTDARWYEDQGVPSVLIGPGDYRVAHAFNEWIALDEIPDAMKIYALAALDWLGYEER